MGKKIDNIEITDELLYQYMPIADEMELDELESQLDDNIQFTSKFEKKMERFLWKEKHKWLIEFGKFTAKVAVACLCILGVSFAITMSVDAYRTKFFQTIQELWDDSMQHTYDIGAEDQGFVSHEPTYIPQGYVEVRRIESDNMLSIQYENSDDGYIQFDQIVVKDEGWSVLDSEYKEQHSIKTDRGILQIYIYDDNFFNSYLENGDYVFLLTSEDILIEDIEKIFASIE